MKALGREAADIIHPRNVGGEAVDCHHAAEPFEHLRHQRLGIQEEGSDIHALVLSRISNEERRLFLRFPHLRLTALHGGLLLHGRRVFFIQSRAVVNGAGSLFADAGKTVRTGHSGAAVSGHNPPFRLTPWNRANRRVTAPVKAEARLAVIPPGNPESEHLAAIL